MAARHRGVVSLTLLAAFCLTALSASRLPNLQGRWAFVQVFTEIAVVPLAGEIRRTSTVALFTNVTQEGAELALADTYCFTRVDDGTPLIETAIPEAFMSSLVPLVRLGRVDVSNGGVSFETETHIEVRGARLDDPPNDELPIDADDPRVVDQDEDGKPGMTVRATILGFVKGEIYVVQRVTYRLIGRVIDDQTIVGTIEWTDEQTVLGASNPLLTAQTTGVPDPDASLHRFVMRRVDDGWTCETLGKRIDDLLSLAGV